MSKKIRDETIIEALLISATVRSAAAKLEINEQTIYAENATLSLCRSITSTARANRSSAECAARAGARRGGYAGTIMQDADAPAQTRVSAAAEILRQTVKYTEITDIMQQLDELEAWRREQEQQ